MRATSPDAVASAAPAMRLGALCQGRDNNIQLLRILAAIAVVLFHCYALTNFWIDEPLYRLAPELNLGSLGVKTFFVISGFLVTQSWLNRPHVGSFALARALRIYPALIAATVFTIALAACSSALPLRAFLADNATIDYLLRTASGFEVRDRLPGAFATNPFKDAVNGSLWTLPIELRLYLAIALAGVIGLLARRWRWLVAIVAIGLVALARPQWLNVALGAAGGGAVIAQLALLFALGSLAYVWRNVIPVSIIAAIAAVALIAWNPLGLGRAALFEPLLAYIVLVLGYHPRLDAHAYNRVGDYSYGVYVYAFPLQQTLVERIPSLPPLGLFALALPCTLAVAIVSWHAFERPALALKSRTRSLPANSRGRV
jgi:peptidoglycan/LPS O-acetylase OafA/YrhL